MGVVIRQKPVALLLSLIVLVFFLSTPLLATEHNHFSGHDHSVAHSTIECVWMCAASTFTAQGLFLSPFASSPGCFVGTFTETLYSRDLTAIAHPRAPPSR